MNHSSESSNPFRRPVHSSEYTSAGARAVPPVPLSDRYNDGDVDPTNTLLPKASNTYAQQPPHSTTKKQVRISSPPRSPTLLPASASPLPGEHVPTIYSSGAHDESVASVETRSASHRSIQHYPGRRRSSSSSGEEDSSSGEEEADRSRRVVNMASATASEGRATSHVPPNPFSRTLADMEESLGSSSVERAPEAAESHSSLPERSNRQTMDVNAFKTLLMTGKTSGEAPVQQQLAPRSAAAALTLADNSSSTDTSSISRHSIMDNPTTSHETPRSSYERSLSDDEEEDATTLPQRTLSKRVKPPPPRHRHGKSVTSTGPQIVAFDDFSKIGQQEPDVTSPVSEERTAKSRTPSETKKPLPPLPPAARGTAMRDALAGAAVSSEHSRDPTPSPDLTTTEHTALTQPKKPPPPPLARRSSQRTPVPSLERTRSNAGSIRHSRMDDNESIAESTTSSIRNGPPPPPPARRSGGISSTPASRDESSPASIHRAPSLKSPPPPPARNRASSNLSSTSIPPPVSAGHTPTQSTSTSSNYPPKPPPPRRTSSRSSIDLPAPRRTSGEMIRSSFDSERRPSFSSSIRRAPITEEEGGESAVVLTSPTSGQSKDILADMDRLQQEIDALMARDELGRRKGSAGSASMQRVESGPSAQ